MKVFICQVCGHIEFNDAPGNCPVCGAPQNQFKQNDNIFKESQENSPEADVKHIPAVTINKECKLIPEEGCTDAFIRIGETLHPSVEKHFIQFIDAYMDDKFIERIYLSPDVYPAACLHLKNDSGKLTVVENCNIHGYWMAEVNV